MLLCPGHSSRNWSKAFNETDKIPALTGMIFYKKETNITKKRNVEHVRLYQILRRIIVQGREIKMGGLMVLLFNFT